IFLREYLLTKLPEIKKSRRLQSYDDMLLNMREALKDENGKLNPHCELARKLRNKYKAVLIDEFQDTDPIQCQIFETIFRHKDCVYIMIGDPKQSIYKFRNADVYAYLAAKDKIEGNTKTLTENFRSRQEVLDGINELFSGERPFYNEKIPYTKITAGKNSKADEKSLILPENEKPFQLDWLDSEVAKTNIFDDVCEWTAYRIALSLSKYRWEGKKNGKISPSDIAVLVPKNSDALSIKNALKR
ncbi:MAG: UvrD-helicase domain-containing protein, partial [Candidatus Nanoarchaeia archaeon]